MVNSNVRGALKSLDAHFSFRLPQLILAIIICLFAMTYDSVCDFGDVFLKIGFGVAVDSYLIYVPLLLAYAFFVFADAPSRYKRFQRRYDSGEGSDSKADLYLAPFEVIFMKMSKKLPRRRLEGSANMITLYLKGFYVAIMIACLFVYELFIVKGISDVNVYLEPKSTFGLYDSLLTASFAACFFFVISSSLYSSSLYTRKEKEILSMNLNVADKGKKGALIKKQFMLCLRIFYFLFFVALSVTASKSFITYTKLGGNGASQGVVERSIGNYSVKNVIGLEKHEDNSFLFEHFVEFYFYDSYSFSLIDDELLMLSSDKLLPVIAEVGKRHARKASEKYDFFKDTKFNLSLADFNSGFLFMYLSSYVLQSPSDANVFFSSLGEKQYQKAVDVYVDKFLNRKSYVEPPKGRISEIMESPKTSGSPLIETVVIHLIAEGMASVDREAFSQESLGSLDTLVLDYKERKKNLKPENLKSEIKDVETMHDAIFGR